MPLVPSVMQVFAAGQQPPQGPQPSPTTSAPRRSPQLQAGQVQRGLPTPPHPTVPILPEQLPEPRIHSPSPLQHAHSQPNVNTHYPRPMRMPPHFLTNFQGMDQNWEMTDELLADIARADQQQSHGHTYSPSSYPTAAHPPRNTDSPPKDPGVERVRATGKSSPKDIDNRRQRDQQMARESPKNRDRQTTSPITSSLAQMQSQTPERRNSPAYHTPLGSPGELPQNYSHSPPIMRRPTIPSSAESRPSLSLSSQTPPSQATNPRSPDRSLPVQEEPEDDNVALRNGSHDDERENWNGDHTHRDHGHVSPTPSSDLNPEGHGTRYDSVRSQSGRNSRAGHREEDDDTLIDQNSDKHGDDSNSGGFTPRSPTANLPDIPTERYNHTASTRGRARTGATDQLGLRGFDPAVFDQTAATHDRRLPDQPPQYVEQRKLPQKAQQEPLHDPRARYYTPQIYPDELHNFMDHPTSAYIQAYLRSPRPDAPIPPTPHSQTSPPSPSPLMSSTYGHDLPPFSPVAPAGSPYPYPFTHVRRNHSYSGPNRHQVASSYDPNHPSVISEQMTKQYQMYAQNNLGHISDSTFSPSTTPFPTNYFNQWANWHTTKVLGGRVRDPMSISSSPSHEPISLPIPPEVGMKKKPRPVMRQPSARKPPPRVESTQPRETSPEPSSSGEETAGEEHFAVIEEGNWVHGGMAVTPNDDLGDWVDEDDEDDEDDLLELEYHPSFVNNVEKRRRRWETRWDALNQAVRHRSCYFVDDLGNSDPFFWPF